MNAAQPDMRARAILDCVSCSALHLEYAYVTQCTKLSPCIVEPLPRYARAKNPDDLYQTAGLTYPRNTKNTTRLTWKSETKTCEGTPTNPYLNQTLDIYYTCTFIFVPYPTRENKSL